MGTDGGTGGGGGEGGCLLASLTSMIILSKKGQGDWAQDPSLDPRLLYMLQLNLSTT